MTFLMPENNFEELSVSTDKEIESLQSLVPAKKKIQKQDQYFNWLNLPYEVWLQILVEYELSAKDLAHMELTSRWFSWKGEPHLTCAECTAHAQLTLLM